MKSKYIEALLQSSLRFEEGLSETVAEVQSLKAQEELKYPNAIPIGIPEHELKRQYANYGYKRIPGALHLVSYTDNGRAKRAWDEVHGNNKKLLRYMATGVDLFEVKGKYLVLIKLTPPGEIYANCTCTDFAIRGRGNKLACKHIAGVIMEHYQSAKFSY